MRSGLLDREITLQSSATVISDNGTPVVTWATLATLRAQTH